MSKTTPIAPGIAIVCTDPSVTRAELESYVAAQNEQLLEFCAAWSRLPIACALYEDTKSVPAGMPTIVIMPTCDDPEALAYHTENANGSITGLVGVDTCKQAGVPWTSAASHEVLETAADPFVNVWAQAPSGELIAQEDSDPVQDVTYKIGNVEVSDFVFPSWFDAESRGERYDREGKLSAPFTRTPGGYWVEMRGGATHQVGARAAHKPTVALARGNRRHRAAAALDEGTLDAIRAQAHEHGGPVAQIVADVIAKAKAKAA